MIILARCFIVPRDGAQSLISFARGAVSFWFWQSIPVLLSGLIFTRKTNVVNVVRQESPKTNVVNDVKYHVYHAFSLLLSGVHARARESWPGSSEMPL